MVLEYLTFSNKVIQLLPLYPIKFVFNNNNKELSQTTNEKQVTYQTLKTLINKYSPEWNDGAKCLFHPIFNNGHLQTVYASFLNSSTNNNPTLARGLIELPTLIVTYKRLILDYPDGGKGALDFYVNDSTSNDCNADVQDKSCNLPENVNSQKKPLPFNITYFTQGEVDKLFYEGNNINDSSPMVIFLHGLTGGSNEGYITSILSKLPSHFKSCVLNSRGCNNSTITTPFLYNGYWTNDIRYTIKYLRQIYPKRKFYLLGISLGSSVLVNYLGQEGEHSDVELGIALGVPWDLSITSIYLNKLSILGPVYSKVMASNCLKLIESNLPQLRELNKNPLLDFNGHDWKDRISTIEEFDNVYTSKMFGISSSFEYYRRASPSNRIFNIKTPLITLNSLDDPILGSCYIPHREIENNPYILCLNTTKGGHIGWLDFHGNRWYIEPIVKFLTGYHKDIASNPNVKVELDSRVINVPEIVKKNIIPSYMVEK
ncbi:related to Putative esterase YMR210W [Saccharomycodes ludwigii]|uniref:Related to Putative esterase YMR210W n=1 Tax=Saccharomycodes ludwigii TaxID=36035 RepID=A0A376B325_9ASCO|nr:hypothetical protein SCDLUD_002164 [Saccharomycodes ludwigii]KAH3902344.1 hypothetical protein SCDLUD_002164 [Saccharomycodes ludwigii]SSD59085.1 related to Putative esterase YMR210W [Saccharomycodes ludwigii]